MITSTAVFAASSIPVVSNGVKSLLFRIAESLLVFAVYKIFSLIASAGHLFTAYLMLGEDYIQKICFVASRNKPASGTLLVAVFSVAYLLAQLYGSLLWFLDAPGYVVQSRNVSASAWTGELLDNPAYILQVAAGSANVSSLEGNLPQALGASLFKPSVNITLTETVRRGQPQITNATQSRAGGRIWLDSQGLSVSPDTVAMLPYTTDANGETLDNGCRPRWLSTSMLWNCTFDNLYSRSIFSSIVGQPEVHWDDASDRELDSRYIPPNRLDNIWAAYGQGGGTAVMKQVFTVTKEKRRHTFIQTVFRCTMVSEGTKPLRTTEIVDLLRRTWSTNVTEQHDPYIEKLAETLIAARDSNNSVSTGINAVSNANLSTSQVSWEYLTVETSGVAQYSALRISLSNITLLRSETIDTAPAPFGSCSDASFQNEAYGGKVTGSDCRGRFPRKNPHFFGQVDTSAVLILTGLGDGASNVSSEALDEKVWQWYSGQEQRIDNLLIARGFIVSVDPSLVTVSLDTIEFALSYLQVLLVLLAAVLAAVGWLLLWLFATAHWSSSLLSNLVFSTALAQGGRQQKGPGYLFKTPDIQLRTPKSDATVTINGEAVMVESQFLTPSIQKNAPETARLVSDDGKRT